MSERIAINIIFRALKEGKRENFELNLGELFPVEKFTDLKYRLVHYKRFRFEQDGYNDMIYVRMIGVTPKRQTIFNRNVIDNLLWISSDDEVFDRQYYPISRHCGMIKIEVPPHYRECIIEISAIDKILQMANCLKSL